MQLLRRRNGLALCLHSHEITGIVHTILSRRLTFGDKDVSHSIAKAGQAGLSSSSIDPGDGTTLFSTSCFEVNIVQRTLGTRPRGEQATAVEGKNCSLMIMM